jgi:EmrB/QacA subfamily drug resistance transporter
MSPSAAAAKQKRQSPADPPPAKSKEPKRLSHADVRTIFLGLMLTIFLGAINQTIVATALPTIGRDFGDFENLSWIVTAYLLTSTAVAPLFGKLSDIYGRRAVMLAVLGAFVLGSAACALAPNMLLLIIGRALQGIGGGGLLPLAQIIVADVITPRERGRYQAYASVAWVAAGIAGPLLGGLFAEHLHWAWIFWINVPLGLGAALMTYTTLRRLPRHERPHKLDLVGAALLMAAAIPLLLALTWGGARYSWFSPTILILIGGSCILSAAFAWHLTRAPEPFLPLPILANQVVRWGTAASSCAVGTSIGLTIFLPLYYELVHKLSATDSGLALIPIVAMSTPGSLLSGRAMMHMRHYKSVGIVGLACGSVALIALACWPDLPLAAVIVLTSIAGVGIGTIYPLTTVSVQNAVPMHQVGTATGTMNFFRALNSALAVAAMGAIVLAGLGAVPERGTGTSNLASTLAARGLDFALVFRWVFAAAAVLLVLGLICLIIMEERPLRGPATAANVTPPAPPSGV